MLDCRRGNSGRRPDVWASIYTWDLPPSLELSKSPITIFRQEKDILESQKLALPVWYGGPGIHLTIGSDHHLHVNLGQPQRARHKLCRSLHRLRRLAHTQAQYFLLRGSNPVGPAAVLLLEMGSPGFESHRFRTSSYIDYGRSVV